jgi:hypothetical protein
MRIHLTVPRIGAGVLAAMAVAGLALAGQASAVTVHAKPALRSVAVKTVVVNPATGAIVSERAGAPMIPAISNHNICNTGDACYYTNVIPLADQGFFGSAGTFHGSWPDRSAWDTGKFTAHACWTFSGSHCSQPFGPNTFVTFGGTDVTGTSMTIN